MAEHTRWLEVRQSVTRKDQAYDTGAPEWTLVIETDLPLIPGAIGFDSGALEDLVHEMLDDPDFERIIISEVRLVPSSRRDAGTF